MKAWRRILLLVIIAALAAFGWHWVADDPGYVLIRFRGVNIQTSLLMAVVLLVVIWAAITMLWRLIRWPFGAFSRRHRRISRQRLADGLVALMEGRHGDAERDLSRASRLDTLRGPALLAAAEASSRRGEHGRALETLDEAAQVAPRAARVLRARVLRRDGRPAEAVNMLTPEAESGTLSPGGWREYAMAAVAAGDTRRAREALDPLQKSAVLGSRGYNALESQVLVASIDAAGDGAVLNTLWSQLPKNQRRASVVVDAYARKAASFGLMLPAMDEVESALRREWSPQLVETYGALAGDDLDGRLRRAESWLEGHPNDPSLLLALGRMCVRLKQWPKAHRYLERSIALVPSAAAWEALGDAYAGQDDPALTQRCYRNAIALARGDAAEPLPDNPKATRLDTRPIAVEERNAHGVPRLRE